MKPAVFEAVSYQEERAMTDNRRETKRLGWC